MPAYRISAAALLAVQGCGPAADSAAPPSSDAFADRVVSFEPGDCAGFGEEALPDIVLGPPQGEGSSAGSTDVLSLGEQGSIVLAFDDLQLWDGEGPDLLVFENAFTGWSETGHVAVSQDGETWSEWPCDPEDAAGGYPGCAGVQPVFASGVNDLDPTDPAQAGGDAFDLSELGVEQARYVRIRDSGHNPCSADTGGLDLDAVAVVHGVSI